MKVGPVHVVTDATMQLMQEMMHRFAAGCAEAARERDRLAGLVAEAAWAPHTYLHCPQQARFAPAFLLDADPDDGRSRGAAERVVAAYRRARADHVEPAPCMWQQIEGRSAAFVDALGRGDVATVRGWLARMFQTSAVWGLGYVSEAVPAMLRQSPQASHYQLRFTDLLVSLAEAVGVARLTSPEQQRDAHLRALDVDLDELFRAVERRTGLDLSFPAVGGGYGCTVAGKRVSSDMLLHGCAAWRLRQLGLGPESDVAEIGGGYGCLAALCHRAGCRRYAIYDLPWVNALQGYFLILSLPPGSVRLYGEDEGEVAVLPHWCFGQLPARSVDFVLNTNSLPEMAAETARAYVAGIRRVLRGLFFSVNQEAKAPAGEFGPQQCVAELVAEHGGFATLSRCRWWMRPGYVEEVFRPL
ncbi:MAG TPA: putative sugar O-methyltransferase [Gemmataceae bacterium]|nr:putative sugar O-methyltransferase [Gemmataceae bacterium]